ncbi:MAG: methyltransferase domain-containing protein, partial [Candidatus Zophobacter franzmannii]|nr:methyltransferase domain-containing protein [Candidatus Zophobacter franzmannii]
MQHLLDFLSNESNHEFIEQLRQRFPFSMNETARIVKESPDFPIRELLTLFRLQKKAIKRIPEAEKLAFTEKGVMQSSSTALAKYHAELFKPFNTIADLCCGCGVDLIQLAEGKEKCIAVDLDAETLSTAEFNCKVLDRDNVEFMQVPAEEFTEKVDAIFADPDRRPDAGRRNSPESISPPLSALMNLRENVPNMAIKLSPIMNYHAIRIDGHYTLQFVSELRVLKEILLCVGELARENVSKVTVMLPSGLEFVENKRYVAISEIKQYIYEPDPAIIRAGLVQDLGAVIDSYLVDSHLALLTSDKLIENPWIKAFKVKEIM